MKNGIISELNPVWYKLFIQAGIPPTYHLIKYSSCSEKFDERTKDIVINFLKNNLKNLLIRVGDTYELPYVLFRRYMVMNMIIDGSARVVDALNIYNGQMYNGEKLFGIVRIDFNEKSYKKSNLIKSIIDAHTNGSTMIITIPRSASKNEIKDYFSNIYDILVRDFGVIKW